METEEAGAGSEIEEAGEGSEIGVDEEGLEAEEGIRQYPCTCTVLLYCTLVNTSVPCNLINAVLNILFTVLCAPCFAFNFKSFKGQSTLINFINRQS